MNKKVKVIIVLIVFGIFFSFHNFNDKFETDFIIPDLDNIDNIMIVAHPDDDLLWGGANLIKDNYLVVCITCGENKKRLKEFDKVMKSLDRKYIALGYADQTGTFQSRSNWCNVKKYIEKDLKVIINKKDWKKIVTHNPDGEYGHLQHKMTSRIVTKISDNKDNLFYFGKYYSAKEIEKLNNLKINDNFLKKKEELLLLYPSQDRTIKRLYHMVPYENWLSYEEWYSKS